MAAVESSIPSLAFLTWSIYNTVNLAAYTLLCLFCMSRWSKNFGKRTLFGC